MALHAFYLSDIAYRDNLRRRLDARLDKNAQCWMWTGPRLKNGYGYLSVVYKGRQVHLTTHRVAYVLDHEVIPAGLFVLHRCDHPACCRPDHLWLGTNADNVHDMMAKGRANHRDKARGEDNARATLTAELVRNMRARYAAGETMAAIARSLGVSDGATWAVLMRRTWRHIEGD